ncbi:MAG: oxygen-independent coproporphyrinogen III oxidase [Candidatus Devosia phytovorans]|uniref:Coproporphyrinogen-III oxidase n=1 Tax=Candidatus Devosia phytovorans TaxID=3121372 RepID=A0AAJ5W0A6_9HYPH|nr:oxygen-independent coproporphyrinogen III oxidase [Devosia sp.]WEK06662.1 MAG: oxygen-independent coproporphyrinogen III oxidase [Devosia sp.]
MSEDIAIKLTRPVPRYTSYPTAPHFHTGIGQNQYLTWLGELAEDAEVSLYLHLPFCDRLCWFCGCHTKQTNRYSPITVYLEAMAAEIRTIGAAVGNRPVTAVHWGGGSPSLMSAQDIARTTEMLHEAFNFAEQVTFSVELDPNDMSDHKYAAWAAAGLNRASIGVQDFDPRVQQAINRIQTFEQTRHVVQSVRAVGVTSLNIDMLYGLPHQTLEGAVNTARQVASLRPERIALFGYAHVPWMKKHQGMIDVASLPDALERFRQSQAAAAELVAQGYERIGFDHFALPHDSLAHASRTGRLHRNFQGYTVDSHAALIGLGASAIGRLPQGYIQNVVSTHEYMRRALDGRGAVEKGVALTDDDRVRAYAIERLLCDFALDFDDLRNKFGADAEPVIDDAIAAVADDPNHIAVIHGQRLDVPENRRSFVRSLAACLDAYLQLGPARYSRAV